MARENRTKEFLAQFIFDPRGNGIWFRDDEWHCEYPKGCACECGHVGTNCEYCHISRPCKDYGIEELLALFQEEHDARLEKATDESAHLMEQLEASDAKRGA